MRTDSTPGSWGRGRGSPSGTSTPSLNTRKLLTIFRYFYYCSATMIILRHNNDIIALQQWCQIYKMFHRRASWSRWWTSTALELTHPFLRYFANNRTNLFAGKWTFIYQTLTFKSLTAHQKHLRTSLCGRLRTHWRERREGTDHTGTGGSWNLVIVNVLTDSHLKSFVCDIFDKSDCYKS